MDRGAARRCRLVVHRRAGTVTQVAAPPPRRAGAGADDHLLRRGERDPARGAEACAHGCGAPHIDARCARRGTCRGLWRETGRHDRAALRRPSRRGRGGRVRRGPAPGSRGGRRRPRGRHGIGRADGRDALGRHLLQLLRDQEPRHRRGRHGHHRPRRDRAVRPALPSARHQPGRLAAQPAGLGLAVHRRTTQASRRT